MASDKKCLFAAFAKVVMKPCQIVSDSQIVVDSESLRFVSFQEVKLSEAQHFVKDLERTVEKLDEAVARIYRYGNET